MIPRTCIIVPYYQSSDFYRPGLLKRAIDSINFCTQGIEDKVKMLLVDDGSEFDPPEVIGREVLHLDHQGVSSAINQAMKVAMEERMGDKILILHDDDMLSQGVVRALHSSTSDGFSLSDLYAFVEGTTSSARISIPFQGIPQHYNFLFGLRNFYSCNTMIWDRSLVEEMLGERGYFFDPEIVSGEGWDLALSVTEHALMSGRTVSKTEPFSYKSYSSNCMTERNKQRGIYDDSRRRIFLKHIEIARRLAEQKHINMPSMREVTSKDVTFVHASKMSREPDPYLRSLHREMAVTGAYTWI